MNKSQGHSICISFRYLLLLTFVFFCSCGGGGGSGAGGTSTEAAAELMWVRQWGTSSNDLSEGVAIDSNGYIYVCGHSNGNIDGIANVGGFDVFLKKFDSAGNWIWTKTLASVEDEHASGIALDADGFIYVTGDTQGDLSGNINNGGANAFIAKYDSSGNMLWTKLSGAISGEFGQGIAVDANANVYMTGSTDENANPFNQGNADVFVNKYNAAGILQWRRVFGSTAGDFAYGIAVDGNGNVLITGHTGGDLNGNINAGGADAFIVKYSSAGVLLWTRTLGTSGDELARGIAVDESGNAYITGYTNGNLGGNPYQGAGDAFIAKYDGSGALQWSKLIGSSGQEFGYAIKADNDGSVYVTGSTEGNLDGNSNAGLADVFLVKYDSSGTRRWTTTVGSSEFERGAALDVRNGIIYITGETAGSFSGYTNLGSSDVFLLKYQ
jgi:hypothetical protein